MTQRRSITESFDLYPDDPDAAGYGIKSTWGGAFSPTLIAGRFTGSRAVSLTGSATLLRAYPSTGMVTTGFAIRRVMNSPITNTIVRFLSSLNSAQIQLSCDDIGRLIINRGSDPLANQIGIADDVCLLNNVWHYIEIELYLHDSAGIFNVYVDGLLVDGLSFIGDTRASSDIDLGRIGLYSSNDTVIGYDDLYLEVDGYTRVGEGRMDVMVPNTDVTTTGFTQSTGATVWGVLDEKPANITDYASGITPGDFLRFGATDLVYAPEHVFGVQIESLSTKDEAGTRVLRNKIWGVTLSADGADRAQTLNTYTWGRDWFPREPDLDAVWTLSELTTLEVGLEIVT